MKPTALILGALVLAATFPAPSAAADRDMYFDRRGDYLRARYYNPNLLYWGRGDRAVQFVPTAYYRTDDYFIAMAYRPAPRGRWWTHQNVSYKGMPGTIIQKRTSAFRYRAPATNNYRLSLPATYNDAIAYRKTFIPISRVHRPAPQPAAAPAAPAPTPAPAAAEAPAPADPAPEKPSAQTAADPAPEASSATPEATPEVSPDASPFPNPTPVLRQP